MFDNLLAIFLCYHPSCPCPFYPFLNVCVYIYIYMDILATVRLSDPIYVHSHSCKSFVTTPCISMTKMESKPGKNWH